jgi:arylsulfatase A-like enzyme
VGPGVVPGTRAELTSNVDLGPTFEELAGIASPAYRSGQSLVPTFGNAALVRRNHVFFEHTAQALTKIDPDSALNGDELDRIPSYVAVRSRTGLLIRYDMDTSVKRNAWAFEFYSYANRRWEKTNGFAQPRHAAEVEALLGKLAQWDQCATAKGNQPVAPVCRTITQ